MIQRQIDFTALFNESDSTEEYEAFTEKFKPKKTTDDCLTPPAIYEAVADFVAAEYSLNRADFVRPFYPGGDYEMYQYSENAVVVDNPPFSMLARIIRFYQRRGVKFFLFGPSLTLFSSAFGVAGVCCICTDCTVTYDNGAKVNTAFVTNLEPGYIAKSSPRLQAAVEAAENANRPAPLPHYCYPAEVITQPMLARLSKSGVEFGIAANEAVHVRHIDAQKAKGKTIYGAGLLVSQAQAKAQAEAQETAREETESRAQRNGWDDADGIVWKLSAREKEFVKKLGNK